MAAPVYIVSVYVSFFLSAAALFRRILSNSCSNLNKAGKYHYVLVVLSLSAAAGAAGACRHRPSDDNNLQTQNGN